MRLSPFGPGIGLDAALTYLAGALPRTWRQRTEGTPSHPLRALFQWGLLAVSLDA